MPIAKFSKSVVKKYLHRFPALVARARGLLYSIVGNRVRGSKKFFFRYVFLQGSYKMCFSAKITHVNFFDFN